ncbi:MAG: NAD(P)H-binding protein [Phenylobacterium sp.]|nr:NAD(P)H-binding protein [Phenylobacterium sp.]
MMISIDVDMDVYKALSAKRPAEATPFNDVLRSILDLKAGAVAEQSFGDAAQVKAAADAAAAAGERTLPRQVPKTETKGTVAVVGATGSIGGKVVDEALSRGLNVIAVARDPAKIAPRAGVTVRAGDVNDPKSLAEAIKGADAVVVSVKWAQANVDSLIEGVRASQVKKGLFVVGCGTLMRSDGRLHFNHAAEANGVPPPPIVPAVRAMNALTAVSDFEWTLVSCPMDIASGERVGDFRLGGSHMIFEDNGRSRISEQDFAVAMIDEVQEPHFANKQINVSY